jgi:hypothetical protein
MSNPTDDRDGEATRAVDPSRLGARSPYDALLAQMGELFDIVDGQTSFDNSDAKALFNECARQIHNATVPDPLYQPRTRPPAINEAINDAVLTGTGYLRITASRPDTSLTWERLPHGRPKIPTKQGEVQ